MVTDMFKNEKKQTSNDYYEAYKNITLGLEEEETGFFSLRNIIKIEFTALTIGLFFMGYNNFFNDFSALIKDKYETFNIQDSELIVSLPKTIQPQSNADSDLIFQLEHSDADTILPIEIKEESEIVHQVEYLTKELKVKPADIALLVEIIKSSVNTKPLNRIEESIVLSQAL